MKKLRPLLLAWAAGLAIWLLLGCASLAKTAWHARQGLAATQSLSLEDFTPVGIEPYDAGEEGPWYISTDGDAQLLWQGDAYLNTVWLFIEHESPPQAVMLYWKTPGQADFSPRQSVYGTLTAPDVYTFDLGGVRVSEVRIDPDSQGIGEGEAPIGAYCYVSAASSLTVDLSLNVTALEGAEQGDVTEAIKTAVADYLKEETLEAYTPAISGEKGYRVSYARIGSAILDTEGVEDYENLTVNGGTGNLSIPAKYAAVLGEVTVSYGT